MTVKYKLSHKLLSIFVCIALVITCLPLAAITASAATMPFGILDKTVDNPTVNGWKDIFTDNSTENAGGVWTDKSVFSSVNDFLNATDENEASNQSYHLNMNDENSNFLVSLSAIASNKQVTGYSTIPTDTVFVLDLSSSMQGAGYNSIEPLAAATNSAIKKLLSLNKNNRVAVVLYSGAHNQNGGESLKTRVLMPLDRYTGDAQGNFVEHRYIRGRVVNNQLVLNNSYGAEEGIGVVNGVKNSKGQTEFGLEKNQSRWSVGTFTQDGLHVATEILLESDKKITEEGNVQQGQERMPVMVLMSDGEPSVFSTDYAVGVDDSSDGLNHLQSRHTGSTTSTGAATEFMVQLTAAYSKYRIEQAYTEHDLLFYSLGLEGNSNFATTILDPIKNDSRTRTYWNAYLGNNYQDLRLTNNTVTNFRITTADTVRSPFVAKVNSTAAEDTRANGYNKYRYYIDKYFQAADDTALENVFDDIVDEIILQSKYYPTYVEGSDINYGGYLSMVDTLGKHMEVKDMKHIQIGTQPFYGRNAARELSSVKSLQGLNEIQNNLVKAVESRLGVDTNTALQVILASQGSGNLYFTSNTDFNNAVCWYGKYNDAVKGAEYVGAWDGNGNGTAPADANCAVKSYYFYGAGEASNSVRVGDMRYIEVDVVTFIATGETKVRVRIPASLIPIITYEVMLEGETLDSSASSLTLTGANSPIRLVYEVGLKDNINALNVGTLASDARNDATGNYEFYTNKWDYSGGEINIGVTPPQAVGNSYSYFEPSVENEYMYYQNDTTVYRKDGNNYVPYTSATHPKDVVNGQFYGRRYYYTKPAANSVSAPVEEYYPFDSAHLEKITNSTGSATSWIIPKGSHVFANGERVINYKDGETANFTGGPTGTYKTYSTYYITHTNIDNNVEYNMQVALGNNGRLTMEALQGIRLQKIVPENSGLSEGQTYQFTITPAASNTATLSGSYNLYLVNAIDNDGTGGAIANGSVAASQNSLTVNINGNQTLYIAGLPEGAYTVTEEFGEAYVVSAIGGTPTTANSTTVTVQTDKFTTTSFTNVARQTGNLTIAKELTHSYGTAYNVPADLKFEMTVTLELNGIALANREYAAKQTKDSTVEKITTDANGQFIVNLFDQDEIEIFGLPDGTVASVSETATNGFTPTYWENGVVNGEVDGQVTVMENHISSVLVVNDYNPQQIDNPIITLTVNKELTGRGWASGDEFTFELQKWNANDSKWVKIGNSKKISGSMTQKATNFTAEIQTERYSTIGTYYYRIVEIEPTPHGILGVSYDKALHGFIVEITDTDMDGSLEVGSVQKASTTLQTKVQTSGDVQNGYNVVANFENVFSADATEASIEVDKSVVNLSNSPYATLDGFKFEIYNSDENGNIGSKLANEYQFNPTTITGTTRITIPYTSADLNSEASAKFYYAIKEVSEGKTGWKYSKDVKYVTVDLTTEGTGTDAALVATVYSGLGISGVGSTTAALSFTNTYSPANASINLNVSKTLNGRDMTDGEFAFEIRPYNNDAVNNPILIAQGDSLVGVSHLTAKNIAAKANEKLVAKSAVNFSTMYFDEVGTYFYNVKETSTDGNGVRVDDNTYRVVVTVTDTNGRLNASYHIINVEGTEIPFVNIYTPEPVGYVIDGTKTLIGRNIRNEEFTFVLTESDINGNSIINAKIWTAKNNVSGENTGSFTFDEIMYDEVGTYYYAVTEQSGIEGNGITYSSEKYVVAVEVTYNAETGKFEADSSIVKVSEQSKPVVNEVTFKNTYKAADTSIELEGYKTLTGNRYINANDFAFELYKTRSTYAYSTLTPDVVGNAADGKFVFKNIESLKFTEAGTYYFVVKENIPAEKIKGVTYDTARYNISVTVTDNGNGSLVAQEPVISRVTDEGTENAVTIAFYNAYKGDSASLSLGGTKQLIGRTLLDDEFTFVLNKANEQFAILEGAEEKKAKNKADETFTFGELTFDEVGTYYYVISEDTSNRLERVKYDDTKYYVTVTVRDDTDSGKLIASYTVKTSPDATENAESIVFKNKYTPKPTDITVDININKKVENKGSVSITAEGFEFALQKSGTIEPQKVKTDKNGKAKFMLGFTEADIGNTYNYTLTEVNDGRANVKYSTAKYEIAITVSLDDNNKLTASITQNTVAVQGVVAEFVNEYDYTPPKTNPPNIPNTGDTSNLALWVALLFVSGGGVIGTSIYGKKKKEDA